MRTEKVELTTMIMVKSGDKILLQDRVKKDYKGYAFPGGHVEFGESIVNCAIRETKEETGLDIFDPVLCGIKEFINPCAENSRYMVFLYKAYKFTGELKNSREGQMRWVKRSDLSKLKNKVKDFYQVLDVFDNKENCELYKKEEL